MDVYQSQSNTTEEDVPKTHKTGGIYIKKEIKNIC